MSNKELKKSIVCIFAMVILIIGCNQQRSGGGAGSENARKGSNETEENIYRSGDSMLAAFKRKDWAGFVRYNNPNMTNMMGGPTAFASFINIQMKQIPDTAIKNIALGKILQVVKTSKDQQCVVEQNMEMSLNGNTLNKKTYLIGQSLDGGKSWTFFDASTKTRLTPKMIKPDLSDKLKIPEASTKVNE